MWHCVSHFMACLSFWVSFTTWVLGTIVHAPMGESGKATLQNLKPHLEAQRELELESNFSCLILLMDYLPTLMIIFASNATYTKEINNIFAVSWCGKFVLVFIPTHRWHYLFKLPLIVCYINKYHILLSNFLCR